MWKLFKSSFKAQLIGSMVGILFIPIIFGCIFTYRYFAKDHQEKTQTELKWLSSTKKNVFEDFLNSNLSFLNVLCVNSEVLKAFRLADNLPLSLKENLNLAFDFVGDPTSVNIFLIHAKNGKIFFQHKTQPDLQKSIFSSAFNGSSLQKTVQRVLQTKKPVVSDIRFYTFAGQPVLFMAAPVLNNNQTVMGVVVLQITQKTLDALLQKDLTLKPYLNVYLLEESGRVLTAKNSASEALLVKMDQFKNFHTCTKILDFNQQPAFACALPINLSAGVQTNGKWFVVSQISYDAYRAPLINLIIFFIILCSFLLLLGGAVAYVMGVRVTTPIVSVIENLKDITAGNLNVNVKVLNNEHEIGKLTQSLKHFVDQLKNQIHDLIENINVISSSSSEISATVAQITASSSETATAITQTASSSEEVSQLATNFNEKAKESLKVGEKAVDISNQGTEAFNRINEGIHEVKKQMDQVANMVIDLSKQSQTIGEITEAVKEIAEQSNILAINASIEATKAGEYGKGFAVVANEVRNLSDQSKKSTQQIQNILDTIQESISKTVLQVEQTNKTIDGSVNFVQKAYESMTQLSASIESLISVLAEISEFAQEQLVGTSQIKEAMENIKEATSQNLDGMRQLEEVIDDLKKTSQNLKTLISMYHVN